MPEHPHSADDSIVNPETHHEESDVNVRALLWFVVIFIAFAAVSNVALWLLFRFYVQLGKRETNAPLTQVARPVDANVPELPRLQPFPTTGKTEVRSPVADTPVADMKEMRAHEDQILNNYGWVDSQKGTTHIPIEQAKQLALQRGTYAVNTSTAAPVAAGAAQAKTAAAAPAAAPAPGRSFTTTTGTRQ
jgi:hypothetical protein